MLRSLQTTDPATVWLRIHPELVKFGAKNKIPGEKINGLLHFLCTGSKAAKDTLIWAQEKGFLIPHHEDLPTSYSLTDIGCRWQPAKGSEH